MNGNGWSIGRLDAKKCDILLDGDTISGVHASLNYLNGKFYLIDTKSKNGSYLIRNGEKILLNEYKEVLPHDSIVFGASEFAFDDLLSFSNNTPSHIIASLKIIQGVSKSNVKPKQPSKPIQVAPVSRKKIRCMDCMKPIIADLVCPSCNSDKHL